MTHGCATKAKPCAEGKSPVSAPRVTCHALCGTNLKGSDMTITPGEVHERLAFAARRLDELLALNGGRLSGADASCRQQLLQEFFYHLVGAIDVLAQLVNEVRQLGLCSEKVSISSVQKSLPTGDAIGPGLVSLYPQTRGKTLPSNPYGDEAYVFRLYNYRNHVTHRSRNPFLFRVGSVPDTSLFLDPRAGVSSRVPSAKSAQDELRYMLELVRNKCDSVITAL